MNRRGFLMGAGGILALAAAPAIVRADSLMRIIPERTSVLILKWDLVDYATWTLSRDGGKTWERLPYESDGNGVVMRIPAGEILRSPTFYSGPHQVHQ